MRVYTHLYDDQRKQAAVELFADIKNAKGLVPDFGQGGAKAVKNQR
jgi:hypothetical protein